MRSWFRKWSDWLTEDCLAAVRSSCEIAQQALGSAELGLGLQYAYGAGVAKDYVEAHQWLELAAERTDGEVHELAALVQEEIAAKMTAEQLAEAERREGPAA
jgi:TPR repeat protein